MAIGNCCRNWQGTVPTDDRRPSTGSGLTVLFFHPQSHLYYPFPNISVSPEPVEGRLSSVGTVPCQLRQQFPFAIYQRLFLGLCPTLNLFLCIQSFTVRLLFVLPDLATIPL